MITKNSIIESGSNYSILLKKLNLVDFNAIYNLTTQFVNNQPKEAQEKLHKRMKDGLLPVGSEPEMSMSMLYYGKRNYEKLLKALVYIPDPFFDHVVEVIDYGCGQAIGVISYYDYLLLKNKALISSVKRITLIDHCESLLRRAALNSQTLFPDAEIHTILRKIDDLSIKDLIRDNATAKLHIFSDILDNESFSLELLAEVIKTRFFGFSSINQFVCVSPCPGPDHPKTKRLNVFQSLFNTEQSFSEDIEAGHGKRTGHIL